jgi:hypothetical protein
MVANVGRTITVYWGSESPQPAVAGIREKSVTLSGEAVDITNDDSDGWRQLLDAPQVNSVELSCSGVAINDVLRADWFSGAAIGSGTRMQPATFEYSDGGTISGTTTARSPSRQPGCRTVLSSIPRRPKRVMAGIFTDIEMVWRDKPYTIKSHRVMGAIAVVEDIITFPEIAAFGQRQTTPSVRLCQAYAALLKYAGARATPEDVLQLVTTDVSKQLIVMKAITGVLSLALPPAQRAELELAYAQLEAGEDGEAEDAEPKLAAEADPGNAAAVGAAS